MNCVEEGEVITLEEADDVKDNAVEEGEVITLLEEDDNMKNGELQ